MQGSFEERVQEKLEELKLTPSEPVWKNIEREIKPEKRRRFPFWIPFVIVLLAGTGWWLLSGKEQDSAASLNTVPVEPSLAQKESERKLHVATPETKPIPNTVQPANTAPATVNQPEDENMVSKQMAFAAANKSRTVNSERSLSIKAAVPEKNAGGNAEGQKPSTEQPDVRDKSNKVSGQATDLAKNADRSESEIGALFQRSVTDQIKDSLPGSVDSTAVRPEGQRARMPAISTDSAATKKKIAAVRKGWRKMLTLEGGWSRPSAGGLFAANSRRDLSYASPSQGYNSGVNYGLSSEVRAGAAFRVGAGLSKAVGNRWELSAGFQYAYYSVRSRVGEFRSADTAFASINGSVAVGGYYKNNNQQDYTTRFHFLEVPVSIGFRPLPKLPLTLSVGALYGRMLHTNALSFNPWANVYYRDEQAVQKNFFAGFSSLQYTVLKDAGWRLDVGPVVQYHFSGLKRDSTASQRLSFAGFKTTFHF